MTARFHIVTLGCKINQYESHALREAWTAHGCAETDDPAAADVVLFNSCAVTAKAVAEVRAAVRRVRRANADAELVVTGCAAQVLADKLAASFPDATIVPQERKDELLSRPPLPTAQDDPPPDTRPGTEAADKGQGDDDAPPCGPRFQEFTIHGFNRTRAVAKVQDGCSHRCTYCIVPATRGPAVSRPMDAAVAEVRRLFQAGWHEVTLSGINLRQYGRDLAPQCDFWDLFTSLDRDLGPEWAGRARLRISSLDPGQLGPKALDALAASRLACPHLHLSLQSLAPDVLRRMGRGHYGPEDILSWAQEMKTIWPVFGLGADLLTGFPGESEADFRLTLAHAAELPLSYAHVFPYSQRPGTPAATYPDQVPGPVKKARAKALRELAQDKKHAFLARLAEAAGKDAPPLHVVLESTAPARGVSQYYADCTFDGPLPGARLRGLVAARPLRVRRGRLLVCPVDNAGEDA